VRAMGRLKSYCFRADEDEVRLLDEIARELKTSRGALLRAAIKNIIMGYFASKERVEPKKIRVIA
jgi:predicted transcriptional regulator